MSEPMGRTMLKRQELYRDRWSSFGERTGLVSLSERPSAKELARFDIFREYDEKFLEDLSPDVSIARWKPGVVLFEEGSYIDLAFFVVEGAVDVYLEIHRQDDHAARRTPIFDPKRTSMMNLEDLEALLAQSGADGPGHPTTSTSPVTSRTILHRSGSGEPSGPVGAGAGNITFLATMDFDLPQGADMRLGPGELFGEIGAMSGWPQSVTAQTAEECTLVQIRVAALRKMRRRSSALKDRLDDVYRRTSLADQLAATPLFVDLPTEFLQSLKETIELVSLEPGEVLTREGEEADALYLLRSGFLQLAQRVGEGDLVVNYLSKGMTLGEVETLVDHTGGWTVTASSVEFAELVKIPKPQLIALLRRFPQVEKKLWESVVDRVREAGFSRRNVAHSELTRTALDLGLVQGNSMLVIDLETCTRCDDCVRACAATHEGRPRFVREGEKYGNLQIARSCYHCRDPMCLVGCPTGAIHRAGVGAVVAVDEGICIGCGSCARGCPYDAIVMHDTEETWPDDMIPEGLRGRPRQVASKCDLCHTRDGGPACVENCPNGCAYRIGSLEEFEDLLSRRTG